MLIVGVQHERVGHLPLQMLDYRVVFPVFSRYFLRKRARSGHNRPPLWLCTEPFSNCLASETGAYAAARGAFAATAIKATASNLTLRRTSDEIRTVFGICRRTAAGGRWRDQRE